MDICPCNICPDDIFPYQQYLSCYWTDFDQILKVGSWDLSEHIPNVTMTFVQTTFLRHLYILGISQLLLTWFWPNFKGRFLGQCLTDAKWHNNICPGNIFPGNICQYQEYISCCWPNHDQTFCTQFFADLNFFRSNFFRTKILFNPNFFDIKLFLTQHFFGPYLLWTQIFVFPILYGFNFFGPKIFWDQNCFLDQKFFLTENQISNLLISVL